ncbi:MAG: hypothetical protein PUD38_00830 [Firmicutes bacterium]|nr:hypothetical protein [Bacillota bacterium]
MAIRRVTGVMRIVANSRRELPMEVNQFIQQNDSIAYQVHATVTYSLSPEAPIGPLGNWSQTVTWTAEGDDNDPVFKQWFDAYNAQSSQPQSAGCYVATAVYGSYDCPQVWTLRRFRDNTLAETWYGRAFIRTYYAISPTLVKWFGNTEWFKRMWKGKLDRLVANLNASGVANTPYEDKVW